MEKEYGRTFVCFGDKGFTWYIDDSFLLESEEVRDSLLNKQSITTYITFLYVTTVAFEFVWIEKKRTVKNYRYISTETKSRLSFLCAA